MDIDEKYLNQEFLNEYVTEEYCRIFLLEKIVFALKAYKKIHKQSVSCDMKKNPIMGYEIITNMEMHLMMIINYLFALIGKGKNDKLSLWKVEKSKVEKFYRENENALHNLRIQRNKIFAHFDIDSLRKKEYLLIPINTDFLEKCVEFLKELIPFEFRFISEVDN